MSNKEAEEIISTYKKLMSECQQIAAKISEVRVSAYTFLLTIAKHCSNLILLLLLFSVELGKR